MPWSEPIVLLSLDPTQHDPTVRQLIRIGCDRLAGFISGGMDAWKAAGLPVETTDRIDVPSLHQVGMKGKGLWSSTCGSGMNILAATLPAR